MPERNKCIGLADKPCPYAKKDSSVKLCQGDLLLCPECKEIRFPTTVPVPKVVIQPILTYMASSLNNSSHENIKKAVIGYFSLQQIIEAKDTLYSVANNSIIGDKVSSRVSTTRTEAEAHVVDMLQCMGKLDKAKSMPQFCVDFKNLFLIPRSQPEELNDISLCDRLNNIESVMSNVQSTLDRVIAENIALRETKMASHPAQPIANTYASKTASPPPQAQTSLHMVQSNVIPKYPSAETVLAGPSVSNQVDDFQIPKYHKKRQQKTVLGKKTGDTRLKVGPEPSREVFVYRVDKSTNIEDMRDFVVNEGFTVRDI
jgi:hypothetical protein